MVYCKEYTIWDPQRIFQMLTYLFCGENHIDKLTYICNLNIQYRIYELIKSQINVHVFISLNFSWFYYGIINEFLSQRLSKCRINFRQPLLKSVCHI